MPKPIHRRRLTLAMAAVALAVPSAVLASAAQPAKTTAVAEPVAKKAAKSKPAASLTPAELASSEGRTGPGKEAVLRSLLDVLPEFDSREASEFLPPGRPPGRPPDPPGHNNPPNPPGKPPGRPPSQARNSGH
jgi:hypothetical protein